MSLWELALTRFRGSLGALSVSSVFIIIGSLLVPLIPLFIMLTTAGISAAELAAMLQQVDPQELAQGAVPAAFGRLLGGMLAAGIAYVVLALVLGPALMAGLLTVAVAAARGRAGVGDFFRGATRYYLRFLGLMIMIGITALLVMVVSIFLLRIPVLGVLFTVLLELLFGMFAIYAMIMIPMDDAGVMAAMGRALSGVIRRPGDALLTLLFFLVSTLVTLVVPIIVMAMGVAAQNIPVVIGAYLVALVLGLLLTPYHCLYTAVRFDSRVRPAL